MWGWLTALIQGLLAGFNQWAANRQARADATTVGQQNQQIADDQAALKAQQAEAQAQADAGKTVADVEGELDKDQF